MKVCSFLKSLNFIYYYLGKVEEAQIASKQVDQLKEERAQIKRENQSGHWIQQKAEIGVAQEKQMEVCDVCGAFLIVNDVQQRVDDHLMGKQHVGFGRLKTALDEILKLRQKEEEKEYNSENDYHRDHDRRYRNDSSSSSYRSHHREREHRSHREFSRRERDHQRSSSHRHRHRSRTRSRSPSEKSFLSRSRSDRSYRNQSNGTSKQ